MTRAATVGAKTCASGGVLCGLCGLAFHNRFERSRWKPIPFVFEARGGTMRGVSACPKNRNGLLCGPRWIEGADSRECMDGWLACLSIKNSLYPLPCFLSPTLLLCVYPVLPAAAMSCAAHWLVVLQFFSHSSLLCLSYSPLSLILTISHGYSPPSPPATSPSQRGPTPHFTTAMATLDTMSLENNVRIQSRLYGPPRWSRYSARNFKCGRNLG